LLHPSVRTDEMTACTQRFGVFPPCNTEREAKIFAVKETEVVLVEGLSNSEQFQAATKEVRSVTRVVLHYFFFKVVQSGGVVGVDVEWRPDEMVTIVNGLRS